MPSPPTTTDDIRKSVVNSMPQHFINWPVSSTTGFPSTEMQMPHATGGDIVGNVASNALLSVASFEQAQMFEMGMGDPRQQQPITSATHEILTNTAHDHDQAVVGGGDNAVAQVGTKQRKANGSRGGGSVRKRRRTPTSANAEHPQPGAVAEVPGEPSSAINMVGAERPSMADAQSVGTGVSGGGPEAVINNDKTVPRMVGTRTFVCAGCGQDFAQKRDRDAHVRSEHERMFSCHKCPSRFKTKSDANRHVRIVHERVRPYRCKLCPSSFSEKNKLRRHRETVHEKLRPYVCPVCSARFGELGNLRQHTGSLHPDVPLDTAQLRNRVVNNTQIES